MVIPMPHLADRIADLEAQVARLMDEVNQYEGYPGMAQDFEDAKRQRDKYRGVLLAVLAMSSNPVKFERDAITNMVVTAIQEEKL